MESLLSKAVSPREEMTAFETLWGMKGASHKTVAALFEKQRGLPSHVLKIVRSENLFQDDL